MFRSSDVKTFYQEAILGVEKEAVLDGFISKFCKHLAIKSAKHSLCIA